MAVCDLLTILLPAPWYLYHYSFGGHSSHFWSSDSCFLFEFFLETTPQIFHTASNWLTLGLAVQRYVYVCHPTLAKRVCTLHHTKMVVVCLVGLSFMHMMPRIFDRKYSIHSLEHSPPSGTEEALCVVKFAAWLDLVSIDIYFKIFYW